MYTAASTRSGWSAATSVVHTAPHDSATRTARSVRVASITASVSAANSRSRNDSTPRGRSERPLPRPSNVTTRKCRARKAIWAFQKREWMIDHVGMRTTVGSPSP